MTTISSEFSSPKVSVAAYDLNYGQMLQTMKFFKELGVKYDFPRQEESDLPRDNDFSFNEMVKTMLVRGEVEPYMSRAVYTTLCWFSEMLADDQDDALKQFEKTIKNLLERYAPQFNPDFENPSGAGASQSDFENPKISVGYMVGFSNGTNAFLTATQLLSDYVANVTYISKNTSNIKVPNLCLFTSDYQMFANSYIENYQTIYGPDVLTDDDIQIMQKFNVHHS